MTRYDKIAQMKPEQKNHWIDIPELTPWNERIFAEIAVAEELNQKESGKYDELLEQAVDCLYRSHTEQHALPDSVCEEAEKILLPLGPAAKALTMHCVAHAHIDMDWMWGYHETVDVALNTFRTMLDLMNEYPDFTFSQSQAAVYRIAETYDPALFEGIKQRMQEGRWEFAGSTWVELDKNLPDLESMARHILYTRKYLGEHLGVSKEALRLDFHPDSFGHAASVPEIFAAGGVRWFYHCRGLDGQQLYRWRAPSGAEVLALNEPLWYNDFIRPMYLHIVPQFCFRYGVQDMMKIYGVGDHGGGPTRRDIERILEMQKWPVAPTIRFSTYQEFFKTIEPFRENLPVITGQLGPTFTGCYTSQSRMKTINRMGEDRLYEAEMLSTYAKKRAGGADFTRQYRTAWENVLFNQFHDILPGSNTPDSCHHALGSFEETMAAVMAGSASSLRSFAAAIDTSGFSTPDDPMTSRSEGGGVGMDMDEKGRFRLPGTERGRGKTRLIHLFNPTSYQRKGVAEFTLWDWPGDPARMQAKDVNGKVVSCRVTGQKDAGWSHQRTDVLAEVDIPPMGYTTLELSETPKTSFCFAAMPPDPRVTRYRANVLENDLVRIQFDDSNLSILSCFDKVEGKELLSAPAGFVLFHEQKAEGEGVQSGGNAWVEGILTRPVDLHTAGVVSLQGQELDCSLRRRLSYRISLNGMTMDVTASLFEGSPALHLSASVTGLPAADDTGVPHLSFRAPLAYSISHLRCDQQIGTIDREVQAFHDDFTRNFVFGVPAAGERGLALLSDCKYGCRAMDGALYLSLLRASSGPDRYPELGERVFRIGMAPTQGCDTALKELGETFVHWDLPYASNTAHPGSLPLEESLFQVEGDVVISGVKLAEEGDSLIIRVANAHADKAAEASLRFSFPVKAASLTDLAEESLSALPVEENCLNLSLLSGQVVTVSVS